MAEDVELGKEAESTVMAALLRNGLDDAIVTRFSARSAQVIFFWRASSRSAIVRAYRLRHRGRCRGDSDAIIGQGACKQRLPAIFGTAGQELG